MSSEKKDITGGTPKFIAHLKNQAMLNNGPYTLTPLMIINLRE